MVIIISIYLLFIAFGNCCWFKYMQILHSSFLICKIDLSSYSIAPTSKCTNCIIHKWQAGKVNSSIVAVT